MGRDWRRPRTAAELRRSAPNVRAEVLCRCGRPAEVLGIEYPEHEGVMLAGDAVAQVALCIGCLEDDPFFWHDIISLEELAEGITLPRALQGIG